MKFPIPPSLCSLRNLRLQTDLGGVEKDNGKRRLILLEERCAKLISQLA